MLAPDNQVLVELLNLVTTGSCLYQHLSFSGFLFQILSYYLRLEDLRRMQLHK